MNHFRTAPRRTPRSLALLVRGCSVGVAVLALSACGDDTGGSADSGGGASDPAGAVAVEGAWARPTPPDTEISAIYGVVTNDSDTDDELIGADADLCGTTEIHNTEMVDGVMSMKPAVATELVVAAGASLTLEPGGLHIMCLEATEPLVEGETIGLQLEFDQAGTIDLTVPIEQQS